MGGFTAVHLGDPVALRVVPPGGWSAGALGLLAAVIAFFAVLALALALAAGRLGGGLGGRDRRHGDAAGLRRRGRDRGAGAGGARRAAATPGVRSVRMVDLAEQEKLLEPWLGPDIPVESLPLPLLIEVATDRDALEPAAA